MSELQKQLMAKIAEGLKDTYNKCPKCGSLVKKQFKTCPVCKNHII